MNINKALTDWFYGKVAESAFLAQQMARKKSPLVMHYETAGKNPAAPYIVYNILAADENPDSRGVNDNKNECYNAIIDVSITARDTAEARDISQAIFDAFDGQNEDYFEAVACSQPDESFPFDAANNVQLFEAVNRIQLIYITH